MKIRILISIALLSALGIGAWWYFQSTKSSAKIEQLLPETGLLVVHGQSLKSNLSELNQYSWFEAVKTIPVIETLGNWSAKVDSLQDVGQLRSAVTDLPYWISFHSTSSEEISTLFFLQAKGFDWSRQNIIGILEILTGSEFSLETQVYNGFELINVRNADYSFVMLIEGDFLTISESNLLVEDVVRAIENESSRLLKEDLIVSNAEVLAYLNSARLKEIQSTFFKSVKSNEWDYGTVASFGFNFNDEAIRLQGSLNAPSDRSNAVSLFAKSLIPISASDFKWFPIQISAENYAQWISNEALMVDLDMNYEELSQVLILNATDTSRLKAELFDLSESLTSEADSTAYSESFQNTDLGFIQQADFVNNLTSGTVQMEEPYFAVFQNHLLLSHDLDALKTVMSDFESENTWGRSVARRRLLDDLVQDTDLTIVQDFNYAYEPIFDQLKPRWIEFFEERESLKRLFDRFVLQLNATQQGYLVASELSFKEGLESASTTPTQNENSQSFSVKANVFADTVLTTRPFVVRNHLNSSLEVIFQDELQDLYLTNRQGEVLWQKKIAGKIKGDLHQIDYFNNRKLQYLFFTDSLVHLVDRNGNDVEGFPKSFNIPMEIQGTAVIDYDNSKRYRYLATDRRGNVYLFDKEVNLLSGWDPNAQGGELLGVPFHVRVRGRDAFVTVERRGEINLLTRRGEPYEGFPKAYDLRYEGEVALVKGPSFNNSSLAVIDREGKLIEVNFEGKELSNKQIFRPSLNDEFSMVEDVLETGYRILRNDGSRVTFFNEKGEEIFNTVWPNSKSVEAEYYNFRNGKEIFVLRDLERETLDLFNGTGEKLGGSIPAAHKASILYYQNTEQYEVFVNFANQLNIYAIDAQ